MNILSRLMQGFKQKSNTVTWFNLLGINSKPQNLYYGTVYACIDITAQNIAACEYYLTKTVRGKKERVYDHPFLDLLHRPNSYQTGSDVLYLLSTYLDTHGDAFILPIRALNKKNIIELYVLDPSRVTVIAGKSELVVGYKYLTRENKEEYFAADDLVPIVQPNPYNQLRGVSTIAMAKHEIEADYNSIVWNKNFFENGAIPSGVLTVKDTLEDDSFARLKSEWKRNYEGKANAYKTAILEGGVEYKVINPSQKDMDFIEQRRFSRDQILSVFKVPKSLVAITDDVNRANAETQEYVFAKRVLKPRLNLIREKLNRFLLAQYPDMQGYSLEFENPVPDDKEYTLKRKKESVGLWVTPNEIREEEGREPINDGDTLSRLVTQNTSTSEKKGLQSKSVKTSNQADEYIKLTSDFLNQKEGEMIKDLNDLYKELLDMIGKIEKKTFAVHKKESADEIVSSIYPQTSSWLEKVKKVLASYGITAIKASYTNNEDVYKLGAEFSLVNVNALEWLKGRIETTASDIDQTLYNRVREIVQQNMDQQVFDVDKLKKEVVATLTDEQAWRIERIARNELMTSYGQSSYITYKQAGVSRKEWYTALDERVCVWCGPLHGTVVHIDDKFTSSAENVSHTKHTTPLHINCRCTLLPVIE